MTNTWHHQDPLQLSEDEWATLLKDPSIIDEIGQKMLTFVYSQPNHQSSATEIGEALRGVPQQRVTALIAGSQDESISDLAKNLLKI